MSNGALICSGIVDNKLNDGTKLGNEDTKIIDKKNKFLFNNRLILCKSLKVGTLVFLTDMQVNSKL